MSVVKFAVSTGAMVVASMSLACGVAAADDYAGQKYSDASQAISDAGDKAVIASRTGDAEADDDCTVTSSEKAPWIKGDDFAPVTDTVLVYLNCNAGVATATTPGNSAASPAGRAAMEQAKDEKAKKDAEAKGDSSKDSTATG